MCIAEQMRNLFKEIPLLNSIITYRCLNNTGKDLRETGNHFSHLTPPETWRKFDN